MTTTGEVAEVSACSQETAGSKPFKAFREEKADLREGSPDSPQEQAGSDDVNTAIICQVNAHGLFDGHIQVPSSLTSDDNHDILDIEHLRTRDGNFDGVWFAAAATAYRTTSKTILWSYTIPEDILSFARKATVPCGVLVLLGLANSSETPEWATQRNTQDDEGDAFFDKMTERRLAAQADASMSPEQRRAAAGNMRRAEQQQRIRKCGFRLVSCPGRDQTNRYVISARPGAT